MQVFCISEGGSNLAGPGFGLFIVNEETVATAPLPRTGGSSTGLILTGAVLLFVGLLYIRAPARASVRALTTTNPSTPRSALVRYIE